MEFLHQEFDLKPDEVVEVTLDHPANVMLLDPSNFEHYKNRRSYRYVGGYVTKSPFRLRPRHGGRWHLVIDLGGNAGTVKAVSRVVSESPVSA